VTTPAVPLAQPALVGLSAGQELGLACAQAESFGRLLAPLAAGHDRHESFSPTLLTLLKEQGVWSAVHGRDGAHPGLAVQCAWAEALAAACPATAILVQSQMTLAHTLLLGGTPSAQDVVADMRRGLITGWGLTEAGAGSDVLAMTSTATLAGDSYVIRGSKRFISNAGMAGLYLVFARTAPEHSSRAISAFLVPADAEGLSVPRHERKLGLRASCTGDVIFDDVRVGADALVGGIGDGVSLALNTLRWSRPLIGAVSLGIARGAYEALRVLIGSQPGGLAVLSGARQDDGHRVADLAIAIAAARALLYDVAGRADEEGSLPAVWEASASKTFCSDLAVRVVCEALVIAGRAAVKPGAPLERYFRDAKVTQIFEGTNQIQRNAIVKALPSFSGSGPANARPAAVGKAGPHPTSEATR
jgi:alkylation response protein AidB-like acyl-CoA dehydrogenase